MFPGFLHETAFVTTLSVRFGKDDDRTAECKHTEPSAGRLKGNPYE